MMHKLLVQNSDGRWYFCLLGSEAECMAHVARNDFRTPWEVVPL